MKRLTLVILLILFLSSLLYAKESGGPLLNIQQDTYDFGKVMEGKILEHAFLVKNMGSEELRILRVRPG